MSIAPKHQSLSLSFRSINSVVRAMTQRQPTQEAGEDYEEEEKVPYSPQDDFVIEFVTRIISLRPRLDLRLSDTCLDGYHILCCGHLVDDTMYHPRACNSACAWISNLKPHSWNDLARLRDQSAGISPQPYIDGQAYRFQDTEERSVCPFCYFKEVLIRWYYFVQASGLAVNEAAFDTEELVDNPLPVDIFPEIVEVTRKVNGHVYAWAGPEIIIYSHLNLDKYDLCAFIGKALVNTNNGEIPLPRPPQQPSFATIIRGERGSIKEVKLIPFDSKIRKTVAWRETSELRSAPAKDGVAVLVYQRQDSCHLQ